MSFPKYKYFFFEDGWQDLGQRQSFTRYDKNIKKNLSYETVHELCKTTVNIGKENNELFLFCKSCLIKLDNDL